MWKKFYTTIAVNILHFFNYNKIGNTAGTNHVIWNIVDLFLALAYLVLSFLKLNEVTTFILWINLLTLLRLIVSNIKNSINVREQYEKVYLQKPGLLFKSTYDIKLGIEFCVIAFALVPFWFHGVANEENVIRSFAEIVICMGFMESFLNILAALFQASVEINKLIINK